MMTILYLSPHYDDAVYSCGGAIHLAAQHQHVRILTLMAGEPLPPYPDSPIIRDLHQRWQAGDNPVQERRQEDQEAARILGCITEYANLPDCVYRVADGEALYPSEESLWRVVHPADPAHETLRELVLPEEDALQLFAPLGAGEHVDHLIVRDWALDLMRLHPRWQVWFYEDFPYLRDRDAVADALQRMPPVAEMRELVIPEPSIRARIAAIRAYRSQITTFWENAEAVDADVRHSFMNEANGTFVERCYRFSR